MKRYVVSVLILSTAMLTACNTMSGSGNVVTRQIDVGTFSRLEVSDGFTVILAIGAPEDVTVQVDDNLVDVLDVGVSGDTLHVGLESGTDVTDATLRANVTVSPPSMIEGSGSSTITLASPLRAPSLDVTLSGASRLTGTVRVDDGSLEMSGASNASLSGTAGTLDVTESGASGLGTRELTIDELTIDASGASGAEVSVTRLLSASASGASTIRYAGSPTVAKSDASGASTIKPTG